jgi:hydrogen peroxide-dependent heme synthase
MTSEPVVPSTGVGVLHLFCKPTPLFDGEAVVAAVKAAEGAGCQVVTISMLGHKCDIAVMAIHENLRELRALQTGVQRGGLDVVDSYVSLSEVSEYASQMPEEMKRPRLYPSIPPNHVEYEMPAWCFYPMSKKRGVDANWFTLPYERRSELMHEHGASGRKFAGRIAQYITGSAGLDDFEWGVTLFAVRPDDLKEVVYTMRFDEASAVYAEFGPFYTGMVTPVEELMSSF